MKPIYLLGAAAIAFLLFSKKATPGTTTPGTTPAPGEETLQAWIMQIKANQDWYNLVVQKATDRGISVEESLRIDAQWMIDQGYQLPG